MDCPWQLETVSPSFMSTVSCGVSVMDKQEALDQDPEGSWDPHVFAPDEALSLRQLHQLLHEVPWS